MVADLWGENTAWHKLATIVTQIQLRTKCRVFKILTLDSIITETIVFTFNFEENMLLII
jgi:hypothetical protein